MKEQNILIVDDQPDNLQTIIDFFVESGSLYNIMKAPNGSAALKVIEKVIPDLIITDWEMPEMDGIEFTKQLRKQSSTKDIPVIICTGAMTTPENLQTALDAGATDYIRKPVDKIELLARTNSALLLAKSYQDIIEKNKELKELNKTKDKFFSIIAHDLKSPFNSLLGFGQHLKEDFKDYTIDEIVMMIGVMHETALKGYKLLENLLEWSRMQTGKITFEPENINLKDVIDNNIDLLKQNALKKEISLSSNLHETILVNGDQNMINTIFRNLISNAIKFTHKRGEISIDCIKIDDSVQIKVTDTGIGIPEEIIEKMFKIDENISRKGTEKESGTGLGLILCKEFIEKHNRTIVCESEIGKGSCFSFSLELVYAYEEIQTS